MATASSPDLTVACSCPDSSAEHPLAARAGTHPAGRRRRTLLLVPAQRLGPAMAHRSGARTVLAAGRARRGVPTSTAAAPGTDIRLPYPAVFAAFATGWRIEPGRTGDLPPELATAQLLMLYARGGAARYAPANLATHLARRLHPPGTSGPSITPTPGQHRTCAPNQHSSPFQSAGERSASLIGPDRRVGLNVGCERTLCVPSRR
ncbi:MAG: hypothetical protein QOC94_4204 [Actinoplanes sp.]|jgi:hypothetical protein|nr:hypothetical protein [Actinoplanes sp.]